ncbi:MAG: sugar phosphate isomerase/epimerase [Planctomycetaceae bacterium]|nr:sugar phosphate isomerase/epimerase [Planctomycetaceae bacterium]MCB9949787.1 sugar phosphate isomerase/epimerase [Planctomycetaceae bacterium]
MQLACFPNSYGRFGPEAAIEHLPLIGVHCLELPIKNSGVPSFFKETPLLTDASTLEEVDAVVQKINDAGMQVCSCNISSGNVVDPAVVERTLKKLALAERAGVSLVVAGGGEAKTMEEQQRLVQNLRRIGDAAAERGITYCCETHPGAFQDAAAMLATLNAVNHPAIRVNFDTGNIFFYNANANLLDELELIMDWVAHVHIKDTNGRFKDWHFPALGEGGAVDFVAVREKLEEAGYEGPISLEVEGIEGEPEPSLEEYQRRMQASVDHLKSCGWNLDDCCV